MNATTIIQLAIGLVKIASWITRQISEAQWKSSGYREAMQDSLQEMQKRVSSAKEELSKAKELSKEELRKGLEE